MLLLKAYCETFIITVNILIYSGIDFKVDITLVFTFFTFYLIYERTYMNIHVVVSVVDCKHKGNVDKSS